MRVGLYYACRAILYTSMLPTLVMSVRFGDHIDKAPNAPVTVQFFDNRSLTIRDHSYPLDDIYCYVNHWFAKDDIAKLLTNFSYLEEASHAFCRNQEGLVPRFHQISMADMSEEARHDEAFLDKIMKQGGGTITDEVVNGMLLHAAAKCKMAGDGAICDIANCALRGCLRGDSVGYTVLGDCPNPLE